MRFLKEVNNNKGFTLVELMVVVGIIGILSAVAIPKFQTYQAKSKTAEAKIHLAAVYSAEVSLMSDYDNYGTCLVYAGYSGPGTNNYYAVGFSTGGNTANGLVRGNGGSGCTNNVSTPVTGIRSWAANKTVGGFQASVANLNTLGGSVSATGDTFTVFAVGAVSAAFNTLAGAGTEASQWSVDEDKTFVEVNRGF
jgi:prepilin-type N-terminal cleavage/methylation domain-containing protein